MTKRLHWDVDDHRVATVWFNEPGRSVNTLPPETVAEISETLTTIEADRSLRGVIFASEKTSTFLAGADLKKVRGMDQATFDRYLIDGQELYNRIERLVVPTVAAINGHCLGGGLELALACRWRVAADNPTALIGLPETAIGLIPAWGGVVRLTRLIGYEAAAPLLLESRKLSPREALRLGIIDHVVAPDELLVHARRTLAEPPEARRPPGSGANRPVDSAGPQDRAACETALEDAITRTRRTLSPEHVSLPAVDQLIEVLRATCRSGAEAGLRAEREAASALFQIPDCRERLDRFFARK